jgi:hypothetical protein
MRYINSYKNNNIACYIYPDKCEFWALCHVHACLWDFLFSGKNNNKHTVLEEVMVKITATIKL